MKTLKTTFFLLFAIGQSLLATNYYLDATTGKDKNNGTTAKKPWQTLFKANATELKPGDTLFLKSGTVYSGQLATVGSGSALAPIVITTYGGLVKPRIDAHGMFQTTLLMRIKG